MSKPYNEIQKNIARRAILKALKKGVLLRPTECTLCSKTGNIEAHHFDYEYVYRIIWICEKCHRLLHYYANSDMIARKVQENKQTNFYSPKITKAKFTDDQIKEFSNNALPEWTVQEIENRFNVSYRQARKIKNLLIPKV